MVLRHMKRISEPGRGLQSREKDFRAREKDFRAHFRPGKRTSEPQGSREKDFRSGKSFREKDFRARDAASADPPREKDFRMILPIFTLKFEPGKKTSGPGKGLQAQEKDFRSDIILMISSCMRHYVGDILTYPTCF